MTFDRAALIAAFPEFGNDTLFPDAQVAFWCGIANDALTEDLFGARLPVAQALYVAHNLALSAQNAAAAGSGNGASFGAASGPVTSKAVGSVSKSMDVNLTAYAGAGPWNATSYGQRYYQMLQAFAAGGFYVAKTSPFAGGYGLRRLV